MKNRIIILDDDFPTSNKEKVIFKKKIKIPKNFYLTINKPILENRHMFELIKKSAESDIFFINTNIFNNETDIVLFLGYLKGKKSYIFLYDVTGDIPEYLVNILSMKENIFFLKSTRADEINIPQVITYVQKNF